MQYLVIEIGPGIAEFRGCPYCMHRRAAKGIAPVWRNGLSVEQRWPVAQWILAGMRDLLVSVGNFQHGLRHEQQHQAAEMSTEVFALSCLGDRKSRSFVCSAPDETNQSPFQGSQTKYWLVGVFGCHGSNFSPAPWVFLRDLKLE